ncbi:hypothetical protein LCGC14_0143170 [marine sediment metagenome]|uniref:Uncharacterized protein n=1 Tax=marine sediment metagenome TaxID=412755 RepID=A0A0F9V1D4_9ZZZZ
MKKLTLTDLVQHYCKLSGKWAVVLFPDPDINHSFDELRKAVPFLVVNDVHGVDCLVNCTCEGDDQAVADGLMIVLCDSEDECWDVFNQIKGDDMPEDNDYNGPCRVYAWTCNNNGVIETENT